MDNDRKFDLNKTMDEMDAKMDELREKMRLTADAGKDAIKDAVDAAQGEVSHWTEKTRQLAEGSKSKLSAGLLKAQMTVRAQKEELERKIAQKRYESAREKAEDEVEEAAEYAEAAMEYAMMAMDEAKLAFLIAMEKKLEYNETYDS